VKLTLEALEERQLLSQLIPVSHAAVFHPAVTVNGVTSAAYTTPAYTEWVSAPTTGSPAATGGSSVHTGGYVIGTGTSSSNTSSAPVHTGGYAIGTGASSSSIGNAGSSGNAGGTGSPSSPNTSPVHTSGYLIGTDTSLSSIGNAGLGGHAGSPGNSASTSNSSVHGGGSGASLHTSGAASGQTGGSQLQVVGANALAAPKDFAVGGAQISAAKGPYQNVGLVQAPVPGGQLKTVGDQLAQQAQDAAAAQALARRLFPKGLFSTPAGLVATDLSNFLGDVVSGPNGRVMIPKANVLAAMRAGQVKTQADLQALVKANYDAWMKDHGADAVPTIPEGTAYQPVAASPEYVQMMLMLGGSVDTPGTGSANPPAAIDLAKEFADAVNKATQSAATTGPSSPDAGGATSSPDRTIPTSEVLVTDPKTGQTTTKEVSWVSPDQSVPDQSVPDRQTPTRTVWVIDPQTQQTTIREVKWVSPDQSVADRQTPTSTVWVVDPKTHQMVTREVEWVSPDQSAADRQTPTSTVWYTDLKTAQTTSKEVPWVSPDRSVPDQLPTSSPAPVSTSGSKGANSAPAENHADASKSAGTKEIKSEASGATGGATDGAANSKTSASSDSAGGTETPEAQFDRLEAERDQLVNNSDNYDRKQQLWKNDQARQRFVQIVQQEEELENAHPEVLSSASTDPGSSSDAASSKPDANGQFHLTVSTGNAEVDAAIAQITKGIGTEPWYDAVLDGIAGLHQYANALLHEALPGTGASAGDQNFLQGALTEVGDALFGQAEAWAQVNLVPTEVQSQRLAEAQAQQMIDWMKLDRVITENPQAAAGAVVDALKEKANALKKTDVNKAAGHVTAAAAMMFPGNSEGEEAESLNLLKKAEQELTDLAKKVENVAAKEAETGPAANTSAVDQFFSGYRAMQQRTPPTAPRAPDRPPVPTRPTSTAEGPGGVVRAIQKASGMPTVSASSLQYADRPLGIPIKNIQVGDLVFGKWKTFPKETEVARQLGANTVNDIDLVKLHDRNALASIFGDASGKVKVPAHLQTGFANSSFGSTLEYSNAVLDLAAANGKTVLFDVTHVDLTKVETPRLLRPGMDITEGELVHIKSNPEMFQNTVKFYRNGEQVSWQAVFGGAR
jgi:hypothetical protein